MMRMATFSFSVASNKKPATQRVFFVWLLRFLSGLFLVFFSGAQAEELKKNSLEIGMGVGGQSLNHYRGSSEEETVVLPFPALLYRGDFWRVDERDGVRGKLLGDEDFEFNLSGDLELRSSTEDNVLREGMPELDTAVQLGPELNFNLTGENLNKGWMLRVPVRAAFTVSLDDPQYIGYTFNPKLTYKHPNFYRNWSLKTDLALLYGSSDFHDYYYSVAPEYVTDTRPLYVAEAGYSGAYAKLGFHRREGNWIYRFSLRYDYLGGTEFEDSPLVETDHYYAVSFGVAWMFAKKTW